MIKIKKAEEKHSVNKYRIEDYTIFVVNVPLSHKEDNDIINLLKSNIKDDDLDIRKIN